MAVRTLLRMGNPILYAKNNLVTEFNTPELDNLITDMFETMETKGGVGIAAPQIGVSLQVCVFGFQNSTRYPNTNPVPKTILINPKIEPLSEEKYDDWEGCLSIIVIRGLVPRYRKIRYSGYDQKGNFFEREVEGFHARLVQHEYDHLQEKLFPSRVKDMHYLGFTEELEEAVKTVGTRLP
jgi:peptide deformylase